MNDDNSDRTEDGSNYVFICDKNSNSSEHYKTSPSTQLPSVSHRDWNSANPDDMVVDYEMDPAVDSSESVSLSHQCVEEPSSDFMGKHEFGMYSKLTCQSPALVNTGKPPDPHSNFDSLEAIQDERFDPSKPCLCESDNHYAFGDSSETLELKQTYDMRVDTVNNTFIAHQAIEQGQPLHAPRGLQPTVRDRNALSCSDRTPPHSSQICVRKINCNRENFENLQATPSKTLNKAYTVISDVLMQTESPELGIQCQYSLGNVTKEYTDGTGQGLVGEKEIQAVTLVSDGMEVPNGSVLQEFYCVSEDDSNSETHSHSSYAQQEMGQNLRGTLSDCHVDSECPVLVPAFEKSKTRVLDSECGVTVAEDPHVDSHDNDSNIQSSTEELTQRSVPGQRVSSYAMGWDDSGRATSTDNAACVSAPVKQPLGVGFTLSPVEATKKYNNVENGPRNVRSAPNVKGEPTNTSKPSLGKSSTKTNTTVGSKVRKTEIISYPRPNFKNIKAKVISRSVLQPKDTSLMKDTPNPQVPGGSSLSTVPSKQLTVMNKAPRSDFKADKKAEISINKIHKQHLNKLITSQAAQVTTHSKNASLRVPRTTSATKSNREDVDKTGSPHAGSETGSVAAFFQKIKGILPVKMKSSECLEVTCVSHIDQISPEKGEQDCEAPMEKQELGKQGMNETFESKSLFVVSELCHLLLGTVKKTDVLTMSGL